METSRPNGAEPGQFPAGLRHRHHVQPIPVQHVQAVSYVAAHKSCPPVSSKTRASRPDGAQAGQLAVGGGEVLEEAGLRGSILLDVRLALRVVSYDLRTQSRPAVKALVR